MWGRERAEEGLERSRARSMVCFSSCLVWLRGVVGWLLVVVIGRGWIYMLEGGIGDCGVFESMDWWSIN